ncbi:MAG: acyl-CoA dehydratase activase-related protein [Bacillota bacterium]
MVKRAPARLRVGVPRALLYYEYFPFWRAFLEALGCQVVLSGPTTVKTVEAGARLAVDEACLPVKLFYGHVAELLGRVDAIWVPRVVSVEQREYTCPKFLGLPDMIRFAFKDARIIDTTVDLRRGPGRLYKASCVAGHSLGASACRALAACRQGLAAQRRFQTLMASGFTAGEALGEGGTDNPGCLASGDRHRIAVLGHSYIVHDARAGMGILPCLRRLGHQVLTAEVIPPKAVAATAARLPKALFWTYEKRVLGSAYYLLRHGLVDGIIQVVSFGCGPDSMVGELIQREAAQTMRVPYMALTLDEHSGEAGVYTRLEAFLDMLGRRVAWGVGS